MTMQVVSVCLSALLLVKTADAGRVQFNPVESLFSGSVFRSPSSSNSMNATTVRLPRPDPNAPTLEEREAERAARRERMRERNERMKEAIKFIRPDTVERVSDEDFESLQEEHPSLRKLGWAQFTGSGNTINYADPGDDYDMWQQAYRMLGGFIDCDHKKDNEGSHDNQDGDNNNNNEDDQSCSRWMLWASVSASFNIANDYCGDVLCDYPHGFY